MNHHPSAAETFAFGDAKLRVAPVELASANRHVARWHRHHAPVVGHVASLGLWRNGALVGVAILGRPVARNLDDGETLEVTRLCVKPGVPNGCSKLYAAAARVARERGARLITYTLESEPGTSLRAAGWREDGVTRGGSWDRPSRARVDKAPTVPKRRWWAPTQGAEVKP